MRPNCRPTQPTAGAHASRREFLKTSASVTTAVALGSLDITRLAHAAGSDTLRVGMIGCGGRNAGAAVQALTADAGARLVAMCDLFTDRIRAKRQEIQRQRPSQTTVDDEHCFDGFEGYRRVIESSDVVLIANAAKFHPLHLLSAIRAGKHVFVEKPHAIDPAGIKVVNAACELAREKRLSVVSGLQSRCHPGYLETIQRIHDGAIGEVVTLEETWLRPPYGLVERTPGLTELQYQCSNQYHFNWLSGDDVAQTLVHNLDRATWVMRGQTPVKCHGLGGRASLSGDVYGNVFDHHSIIYEYANGVRLYAFCRTAYGCHDESGSLVFGTKGRADITGCRITGETNWRWQGAGDPYQIEHDRFFASIRAGVPLNNGDYMSRSTLTAIMGQISCYTGKEALWDDMSKSEFYFPPKPEECRWEMEPPVKPGLDGTYPVYRPGSTTLT